MTPRERILATLDRQPTDRVPVDLWLTPEVLQALREHTGVHEELALYAHLGIDKIVWVFPGFLSESFDPNDSHGRDPWGVPTLKVRSGQATYQEFGKGPLADFDEPEQLDTYPLWPDPDHFNLNAARQYAEHARAFDFAVIGPWISHFEVYCHLRGMENALMDIVSEPAFIEAALDRIDQIQTVMLERYLAALGDLVDIVFISDDMGTQHGQLISTQAWKTHFEPRLRRWCDLIHRHQKKVLFHTDGSVRDLLPHLAACGIDILNPIQHICNGMDRADLNRDFGDRLCFHGGVENQHVLPFGSVDDVRHEVTTCLQTLGHGGGYIPSSCHNIQAGTPVPNVLAMIDTVHNWKTLS